MGNRVSYPIHIKEMAIQMKQEKTPVKMIMEKLGIKNKIQIETWWSWYRNDENHRLVQPVGKQDSYGKGPENQSNKQQHKLRFLFSAFFTLSSITKNAFISSIKKWRNQWKRYIHLKLSFMKRLVPFSF